MRSLRTLVAALVLLPAACGGGPDAPAIGDTELVCAAEFCVEHPDGWSVEVGDDHLSFVHPDAPETALASVGRVSMEGIVGAAGGSWPASTESVVRDLWTLLGEGSDAAVATVERRADGSVVSFGSFEGGRMWHRLVPTDGGSAIGVEIRGPNRSWESHAAVFVDSLTVTP